MTDGLKSEHRRAIIETLSANPKVERIVLFGSRAMGTFTPTSDIDLALFGDDLTLSDQAALAEAMAELSIPQRVDILIHHRIENRALREHIRKHGVEWFARRRAAGTAGNAGEWREARFGEVAGILPGKYIPASDYDPAGGYLIYGSNSIMGRVRLPLYEGPIIAFARIGSNCGATMYSAGPCWINNNAAGIRAKAGCDTRFLYYWMQSFDFAQIREGSGQPYISDRTLKELVLLLPPLPEQRAIAHILGTLDDKIELNRRMSQTLEQMARALFKAWFVDFEPVRAKMEGRWRRGESLPGLPAHLYDLFPDRLVESELGEIPEGWEVRTLGKLSEKPEYGYTASAKEKPVGPKFLRITDINKLAWIDWSTVPFCEVDQENFEQYRLYPGDVLIARMADPGHGVVIEEQVEAVFASYLIRFRLKDRAYIRYIQYWLRSERYWELVASRHAGTTRASLNAQVLSSFQFFVPPKPIASAFGEIVNGLRSKLVAAVNESRTLSALRDALLPKLISGELRVKDAERFLEGRGL